MLERFSPFFFLLNNMKEQYFNKKETLQKLMPLIQNTAMRYNLIPVEVSLTKENHNWFLRIFIHSNEHPVSHQDCENLTRGIGDFLDELIPFKYYLEVSSLGLERKLKSPIEYVIFKGKIADIKLKNPIEDEKKFKVKILEYDGADKITFLKLNTNTVFTIKQDEIFSTQLCLEQEKKND